ncbi:hypothetical protein [Amycolatopsis sp. cg9]|uniref:hypothetical protein n=1 Tax=Amycolatopsis sp. cg9 TaxID=3238801 RepID=UPI003524E26E
MELESLVADDVIGEVRLPAVRTTGERNAALNGRKPRVDADTLSLYCDGNPSARGQCGFHS